MDVYQSKSIVRFLTFGVALVKFGSTVSIATKVYACRMEFEQRSFIPDNDILPDARKALMYIGCILYIGLTAGCIILILMATLGLVGAVASKSLLIFSFGMLSIFAFLLEITTAVTLFKVSSTMDEAIGEPIRQKFETIYQKGLTPNRRLANETSMTRHLISFSLTLPPGIRDEFNDQWGDWLHWLESYQEFEEDHDQWDTVLRRAIDRRAVPFESSTKVPDEPPNHDEGENAEDHGTDPSTKADVNTTYLDLKMLDNMQNRMQCCGVDGPSFWFKTGSNGTFLPSSCCLFSLLTNCTEETAFQRGCLTGLSECRECFYTLQMAFAVFCIFSFLSFALAMMYTVLNHKYPPMPGYEYDLPSSASDDSL